MPVTIYQGRWSCRIICRIYKEKESAFATLQQTLIFYHKLVENRSKIRRAIAWTVRKRTEKFW